MQIPGFSWALKVVVKNDRQWYKLFSPFLFFQVDELFPEKHICKKL